MKARHATPSASTASPPSCHSSSPCLTQHKSHIDKRHGTQMRDNRHDNKSSHVPRPLSSRLCVSTSRCAKGYIMTHSKEPYHQRKSNLAQWKRAGLITRRSHDRNVQLLNGITSFFASFAL
ncbi:hypothetical protein J3F84DRAFT_382852 [Trichoderma pleuroticola]